MFLVLVLFLYSLLVVLLLLFIVYRLNCMMNKRRNTIQIPNSVVVSNINEKKRIVDIFPKIELCNETLLHQKVHNADIYIATPYGTKYFMWLTTTDHLFCDHRPSTAVCIFIESSGNAMNHLHTQHIFYVPVSCPQGWWPNGHNRIFHGIMFKPIKMSSHYFALNHIYDTKTAHISGHKTFAQYLQTLNYIFNDATFVASIRNPLIQHHSLHIGAPIMDRQFSQIISKIHDLPYNVQYIYFRYMNQSENEKVQFVKYFKPNKNKISNDGYNATATTANKVATSISQTKESRNHNAGEAGCTTNASTSTIKINKNNNAKNLTHAVFLAYPLLRQDCYNLFAMGDINADINTKEKEVFIDMAFIPNYKTSLMMNNLFRNTKEIHNLDLLEESDDEEEFESSHNNNVDTNVSKQILCEYSPKFKKWVPISLTQNAVVRISDFQ